MQTLINWSAKRAGGRITINGFDKKTGGAVKLVGVDTIAARPRRGKVPWAPVATHKSGERYVLA